MGPCGNGASTQIPSTARRPPNSRPPTRLTSQRPGPTFFPCPRRRLRSPSTEQQPAPVLWRGDNFTDSNLTPRPLSQTPNDVVDYPDNGLSTFNSLAAACGTTNKYAVRLDFAQLLAIPELNVRPDPTKPGHYFLQGFDYERHVQWANTRPALTGVGEANADPITISVENTATVSRKDACP